MDRLHAEFHGLTPTTRSNAAIINQGTLTAQGTTNAILGPVTASAGSTLRIEGILGGSSLTVAQGFTNHGAIELTEVAYNHGAKLTVSNGTLTNAADGTINSLVGNSGARTISGAVENRGLIDADQSLRIVNDGRVFVSTVGTVDVAHGKSVTVQGGTARPGAATTLLGSGTVDLAGTHVLELPSDLTLASSGAGLTFSGSVTVNGPGTLINRQRPAATWAAQGSRRILATTWLSAASAGRSRPRR